MPANYTSPTKSGYMFNPRPLSFLDSDLATLVNHSLHITHENPALKFKLANENPALKFKSTNQERVPFKSTNQEQGSGFPSANQEQASGFKSTNQERGSFKATNQERGSFKSANEERESVFKGANQERGFLSTNEERGFKLANERAPMRPLANSVRSLSSTDSSGSSDSSLVDGRECEFNSSGSSFTNFNSSSPSLATSTPVGKRIKEGLKDKRCGSESESSSGFVSTTTSSGPETSGNEECREEPSDWFGLSAPKYGTLIPNRIFVGGISSHTTEQELSALFAPFGNVKGVKIIMDRSGISKGYGFVTFETEEEARMLCDAIYRKEMVPIMHRERRLNVAPAIRKQPTEVVSEGLSLGSYMPHAIYGTGSGDPYANFQPMGGPYFYQPIGPYPPISFEPMGFESDAFGLRPQQVQMGLQPHPYVQAPPPQYYPNGGQTSAYPQQFYYFDMTTNQMLFPVGGPMPGVMNQPMMGYQNNFQPAYSLPSGPIYGNGETTHSFQPQIPTGVNWANGNAGTEF